MTSFLHKALAKNRTEELGYDVWREFVIPPFYDQLDLQEAKKPRVVIGGRGCGKTMLLRYLSHYSTFSQHRTDIPPDALLSIGLYWRADTQFSALMYGRGLEDDVWSSAFHHLLALIVALQVLESMSSITASSVQTFTEADFRAVSVEPLRAFDESIPENVTDLHSHLQSMLWRFETWVANVRTQRTPVFLPGMNFVLALIGLLKQSIPELEKSLFYVYVDEYENLLPYQQRALNTRLKHSEFPLVFHIAAKRNSFEITQTEGDESIVNIADYRIHDIESYLTRDEFELFAAEVLFLQLAVAKVTDVPINPSTLRDRSSLESRRQQAYRRHVLDAAHQLFPGLSHEEMANTVFRDAVLHRRLRERLEVALRRRGSVLGPESFDRPTVPEASITATALLYRQRLSPEEIAEQLDALESNRQNRFLGSADWIHNNFIGCLLDLYDGYSEPCIFYSGFTAFATMAHGNLRHLLELCHKSLALQNREDPAAQSVSPMLQAYASREVSSAFLAEIKSFGRLGNQLHAFTLRLGSLFSLAHKKPTQSEPEQSHFAVVKGDSLLTENDRTLLSESVKWSVLFEEEETKLKDLHEVNFEYVLNPIYAPFFHITYRKRRKLELSAEEFGVLARGTYDQVRSLLREYSRRWDVSLQAASPTLFSHLSDGGRQ
jgi:hypothetical protein